MNIKLCIFAAENKNEIMSMNDDIRRLRLPHKLIAKAIGKGTITVWRKVAGHSPWTKLEIEKVTQLIKRYENLA